MVKKNTVSKSASSARKRSQRRRTPPKKSARKRQRRHGDLFKSLIGLLLLALLVVFSGYLTHYLMLRKHPIRTAVPQPDTSQPSPHTAQSYKIPKFEVYPPEKPRPPQKAPALKPRKPIEPKAKIAIIIDDLGYERHIAKQFLSLDTVLTFSILPQGPARRWIAAQAHAKGFEIMLHLPMEPEEYPAVNPGPGALLTSMAPDQLIALLEQNLSAVPHIKGVNNHMGSRMTTMSAKMYQVFTVLKRRGLYFIDSRTTAETLCRPSARLLKVPFAERDVFLDHVHSAATIKNQIRRLLAVAQQQGYAIGIGHPHKVTYQVLKQMLPHIKQEAKLVKASELVREVG